MAFLKKLQIDADRGVRRNTTYLYSYSYSYITSA